ncbi:MAG: hypothetical protein WBE72_03170 [Terracidiphilus sp.]
MPDMLGTPPNANDRPRPAERDNVLYPFDSPELALEKRGALPKYSAVLWPFLIGIALAFIAPRLLDILSGVNPWIERLVFPYVLLAGRPELGLNFEFSGNLPRVILYSQFPLEGLLTMFNLRRRVHAGLAIGQLIFIHLVGAFVLFLLIQPKGH